MTNPERIYRFLTKNKGSVFCDDCLMKELGLKQRQQVQPVTDTLRLTPEFERQRQRGCCSGFHCSDRLKFVIRARP